MSYSTADADIKTALVGVNAIATPDIRRRETDVPAIVWTLIDSNPTQTATGSAAPFHTQYEFTTFELSRIDAERLADDALAALVGSSSSAFVKCPGRRISSSERRYNAALHHSNRDRAH